MTDHLWSWFWKKKNSKTKEAVSLRKQGMSLGKQGFKKKKFNGWCETGGKKEVKI